MKSLNFMNWMKAFIICQPILDIFTSFSITYFQSTITPGIVIRVLFMGVTLLYILFVRQNHYRKIILVYLLSLFILLGGSFVINYFTKPTFYTFQELQYFVKCVYFPVMLCGMFLTFSKDQEDTYFHDTLTPIVFAMLIFTTSIFLAIITGTSNTTYMVKSGYSGWFYAGNEISAIAGICFPLILLYTIFKIKNTNNFFYIIPSILLMVTGFLIGTKVGYFAILLTIIIVFAISFLIWITSFISKGSLPKNPYNKEFAVSLVFLALFLVITPIAPVINNMVSDYENLGENATDQQEANNVETENIDESASSPNDENFLKKIPLVSYVLSYRDVYFQNIYEDYQEADSIHHLFGMGYAGFYEDKPKLVEMDFFDIFFSFGILGFTVYFLPLFYTIYLVMKCLFRNVKKFFSIENILLMVSCCLGFGIAFFAGHVLNAPAVSIYLALSLVLLIKSHLRRLSSE